jgi:hypothetical protein
MMKHKDFATFILTHGRAGRVETFRVLRKCGYTGRIVLIVDDQDKQLGDYKEEFGDQVYVFSKQKAIEMTDECDNFNDRRAVVYARNICWEVARDLGIKYFFMLDDDYNDFRHKMNSKGEFIDRSGMRNMDAVLDAMLDYYISIPAKSIAMGQGGDYVGGMDGSAWRKPKRKVMNSFICATDRPFKFFGSTNEDVNAYATLGSRGDLFITVMKVALQQKQTQANAGGLTDIYKAFGTYVKSFYSVMCHPSSVKVYYLSGSKYDRIHHRVTWRNTVPVILSEEYKKRS